ncbi:MAG: rolling circle replication-associated protein [Candidatus Hermodarchaeia archaeon]
MNYARNYFLGFSIDKDLDFQELQEFYCKWRGFVEYLVLQNQTDKLRVKGEVDRQTIAVKCAKRGNDVYWWRVGKRLNSFTGLKDYSFFDPHSNIKQSKLLFVTLTYDTKRSTIREAWETIGEHFNNWIRNIRKKFGRVSHLRCWEASRKGYPHIHALMIFHDYKFRVTRIQGKNRILEKEEFEKSYHSFVDVQAVSKIKEGIKYVTKYLTKTRHESQTQRLTLALCWLFRKRSFAVSGDFLEQLKTSIKKPVIRLVQIDLHGVEVRLKVEWIFIGIFPAKKLGIDRNEWWKVITDRGVLSEILR